MKTTRTRVPQLAEDQEFAAAEARLNALQIELQGEENILQRIVTRRRLLDIESAARDVVAGGPKPSGNTIDTGPLPQIENVQHEIAVLRRAVTLQEHIRDAAATAASNRLAASVAGTHSTLIANQARALIAYLEATAACDDFTAEMRAAGLHSGGLEPMPAVGSRASRRANADVFLRACVERGFIELSTVPVAWRELWPAVAYQAA